MLSTPQETTTRATTESYSYSSTFWTMQTSETPTETSIYDSSEDLSLDSVTEEEDLDTEQIEEELEEVEADEEDLEEKTNVDNVGLAVTNMGEGNMQMDNRLLPVLPLSKLERLAGECLMDEMKLPCRPGQKWFCENDVGRWRKHKCKSIVQSTMPFSSSRAYKKCACFTPNGDLVYRKLPLQNITRKDLSRSRRDIALLDEDTNDRVHRLTKKERRLHLHQLENTMEDFEDQISGLKLQNDSFNSAPSIKTNLDTNSISSPACIIERGKINCSRVIYKDKKTWLRSRHRIENEIQDLRHKLETLKEIRRHLKNTRPFDGMSIMNGSELNTFNDLSFHQHTLSVDESGNPSILRPMPFDTPIRNNKRRRKRPNVSEEAENVTSTLASIIFDGTTVSPPLFTNHHRHNHRLHTSTQGTPTTIEPKVTTTRSRKTFSAQKPSRNDETIPLPRRKTKKNYCHCEIKDPQITDVRNIAREEKRRLKEERLRRKLRKQRKRDQLEKECNHEKMNCFHHDNDHWKTAPQWTAGPFCFCMNANNNTYSCIRTINTTHNFLYCEFTTGFVTFYNLRIDPFELQNRVNMLKKEEKSYLHNILAQLMACKGKSCNVGHHSKMKNNSNMLPINSGVPQNYKRKFSEEDLGDATKLGGQRIAVKLDTKGKDNTTSTTRTVLKRVGIRKRRKT
ncbi:hypothetical protein JTB14_023183 [Gonioctena quinquepunctata]|nr:hypothetical protein JTB14_023183 [Gonioctena quinquepunctata]